MHFLAIVAVVISISLTNARPDGVTATGPTAGPAPTTETCSDDMCYSGLGSDQQLVDPGKWKRYVPKSATDQHSEHFFVCTGGKAYCYHCGVSDPQTYFNEDCVQCLYAEDDLADSCDYSFTGTPAPAPPCGISKAQLRVRCNAIKTTCKDYDSVTNKLACGYYGVQVGNFEYSVNCGAWDSQLACMHLVGEYWDNYKQCKVAGERPTPTP